MKLNGISMMVLTTSLVKCGKYETLHIQLPFGCENNEHIKIIENGVKNVFDARYIEGSKGYMIRSVKYLDKTLFTISKKCDHDIKRRIIIHTITSSGIFVRVRSIYKKREKNEYYKVDSVSYIRLVDNWDYMMLTRPDRYQKQIGLVPYPIELVVFLPIFKNYPSDVVYACNEHWFWRVLRRRKRSPRGNGILYRNFEIKKIKPLKKISISYPKRGFYKVNKQLYYNMLKQNDMMKQQSTFNCNKTPTECRYQTDCVTPLHSVLAYLKLPRTSNMLYNIS
ncbi:hypothetical protein BdWA1_002679 [Babesia duncani]|uniref:Uncharacterized protein n=1 Tax=Babesia duncani TaxID=323732 RepID=A0AAD9PJM9_9APIC|nr:hypothetical protein BdWA1_002679 [Babesia duncani]